MKKYRFVGDSYSYTWDLNPIKNAIYTSQEISDMRGEEENSSELELRITKWWDDWEEVTDQDVEKQEILDAVNKPLKDGFEDKVTLILDDIKNTLVEKNRKYGDSALNPIRVFSKSSNIEQIKVRLDDKLSRLRTQDIEEDEDVLKDLMGYLVLLRIAVMNNDKT